MKLLFLEKPIWGPSSHHPRIRRKRSDTWNCKNGVPQQGIFQARIQRDLINVAGRTLQADQSSVGQSIHHVLQISGKIRSDQIDISPSFSQSFSQSNDLPNMTKTSGPLNPIFDGHGCSHRGASASHSPLAVPGETWLINATAIDL